MAIKTRIIIIVSLFSCVNCFLSRYHPYPYYPPSKRQIYGTVEDFERIGYQHERRFGFPFFTREGLIIFPSVRNSFFSSKFSFINYYIVDNY